MSGTDPVAAAVTFAGFCGLFLVLCVVTAFIESGRGERLCRDVLSATATVARWITTATRALVRNVSDASSRRLPPTMPWRW